MNGRVSWRGIVLTLCLVAAFFIELGSRGLNEPDEGRYASIAREMAVDGDWLIPHLNGIPHFQKPPIIYWATALSFKCFGFNETAARLPSTLAALGILALTFLIGRKLFGLATGVGAVFVLAALVEFFALARMLTPDMVMSFWITSAIFCLVKHRLDGRRLWGWLFFAAMGLGFMTKGPMAFVVPLSAALVWRRAAEPLPKERRLPWLPGLALALAIGLSWFIVLTVRDPRLGSYFTGYELVQRFASKVHGRSKPFWFFAPVLWFGCAPWSPVFVVMTGDFFRRWRGGWRPVSNAWLLAGWVLPPLIILSLSGSKLVTYVLPLLPALAIGLACWQQKSPVAARCTHLVSAGIFGISAVGLLLSHRWIHQVDVSGLAAPFFLVAMALALASLPMFTTKPISALGVISLTTLAGWLWVATYADRVNDLLGAQPSIRPLARRVKTAPDLDRATLFVVDARLPGWSFYLQRHVSVSLTDSDVLLPLTREQQERMLPDSFKCPALLESRAPAYGIVPDIQFQMLYSTNRWVLLDRAANYCLIATRDAALAQTAPAAKP